MTANGAAHFLAWTLLGSPSTRTIEQSLSFPQKWSLSAAGTQPTQHARSAVLFSTYQHSPHTSSHLDFEHLQRIPQEHSSLGIQSGSWFAFAFDAGVSLQTRRLSVLHPPKSISFSHSFTTQGAVERERPIFFSTPTDGRHTATSMQATTPQKRATRTQNHKKTGHNLQTDKKDFDILTSFGIDTLTTAEQKSSSFYCFSSPFCVQAFAATTCEHNMTLADQYLRAADEKFFAFVRSCVLAFVLFCERLGRYPLGDLEELAHWRVSMDVGCTGATGRTSSIWIGVKVIRKLKNWIEDQGPTVFGSAEASAGGGSIYSFLLLFT
ncbi:hypothetical protein HDK90DRAFT_179612 [Phyllosticta capitalensis]|uniref:Uncharacterized protein n=1 Tax=Phyllosticta capitalensis TaxID=121624 RepID=A0ABR1YVZ2_9PEZI